MHRTWFSREGKNFLLLHLYFVNRALSLCLIWYKFDINLFFFNLRIHFKILRFKIDVYNRFLQDSFLSTVLNLAPYKIFLRRSPNKNYEYSSIDRTIRQYKNRIENRNEFPSKLNGFCGTFEDIREQTRGVQSFESDDPASGKGACMLLPPRKAFYTYGTTLMRWRLAYLGSHELFLSLIVALICCYTLYIHTRLRCNRF